MQIKDVQPFITVPTKNVIYKLSFITGYSVKQICQDLCVHTLRNKRKLGEELSPFLKRDIKMGETQFVAASKPLKHYPINESVERVTVKIGINSYEFAYSLAHALGWSVAKVVAYCIEQSMKDFEYLNFYITRYLDSKMDDNRKKMIEVVMNDINKESEEEHSVASLLLGVVDEIKEADQNVTDAVSQIAESW